MSDLKFVPVIFFIVGLGLLVAAGVMFVRQRAFYGHALRSKGRVLGLVERRTKSNGRVQFAPKIVFTDTGGRSVTFVSSVSTLPPEFRVGEMALVAYDGRNSGHAEVDSFSSRWMGVLIFGGIGTVMTSLGSLVFIMFRRMK